MRARDMTAGVDHDHERRADGQRCDHARPRADYGEADRKNEKESADEFRDVFFHMIKDRMFGAGRILEGVGLDVTTVPPCPRNMRNARSSAGEGSPKLGFGSGE